MEGSYSKGHIRRFAKLSDVLVSVRPLVFSHSLFTRKDTQMNGNTTFYKTEGESVSVVETCHHHGDTHEMQQFLPSSVYYTHPMLTCISLLTNPMVC